MLSHIKALTVAKYSEPISPNSAGDYEYVGLYNGHAYYRRYDKAFYLFYATGPGLYWCITSALGVIPSAYHSNHNTNITALYYAAGGASGRITVTLI